MPHHIEHLWDRNVTLTTRLADTATLLMLLRIVLSGRLQRSKLITYFALNEIEKAYEFFGNAAKEHALKVVLTNK